MMMMMMALRLSSMVLYGVTKHTLPTRYALAPLREERAAVTGFK